MIPRHHIRCKILNTLYARSLNKNYEPYPKAKTLFLNSLEKTEDLFFLVWTIVFSLLDEIKAENNFASEKAKVSKDIFQKIQSIYKNSFIESLKASQIIYNKIQKGNISWLHNEETLHTYFKAIKTQLIEFNENETPSPTLLFYYLFSEILPKLEQFDDFISELDILWADDLVLVYSITAEWIKSLEDSEVSAPNFFSPQSKAFGLNLLRAAIKETEEAKKSIKPVLKNWDIKRISQIDTLILILGYSEIKHFSDIPKSVSMNEYIEIAKNFGGDKSGKFINGVLEKISKNLKEI